MVSIPAVVLNEVDSQVAAEARETCPKCGKEFTKETKGRAKQALLMHDRRVHGNLQGHWSESVGNAKVRGAQAGNTNALTHGLRAIGDLPTGCSWIKGLITQVRNVLELAICERDGELSDYSRCIIKSACRWEQHALLAQRWLRESYSTMDHGTRLAYSREIARASSERDKCLKELRLHETKGQDEMALLYSEVIEVDVNNADAKDGESESK